MRLRLAFLFYEIRQLLQGKPFLPPCGSRIVLTAVLQRHRNMFQRHFPTTTVNEEYQALQLRQTHVFLRNMLHNPKDFYYQVRRYLYKSFFVQHTERPTWQNGDSDYPGNNVSTTRPFFVQKKLTPLQVRTRSRGDRGLLRRPSGRCPSGRITSRHFWVFLRSECR